MGYLKIFWRNTDDVVIGSRTIEEYAFQVCNFMNMLYQNIHYSDNKKVFSTGDSMTLPVVYHNLKVELSLIEKKVIPQDEIKYHSLIDSIKKNLESIKVEDEQSKEIKKKCDDDLFEAFKNIQSCYPNLHLKVDTFILIDMK